MNLDSLRASVVIGLVTETGIRAGELANLRSDEIDTARREVQIVFSKGSSSCKSCRLVPISDFLAGAYRAFREHISAPTSAAIPGRSSEAVNTKVLHRIIAETQLSVGLTAEACGFENVYSNAPAYTYRDFRATAFATWLECGFSSYPIAELAGWRPNPSERPKCFIPGSIPDFMVRRLRERLRLRYDGSAT